MRWSQQEVIHRRRVIMNPTSSTQNRGGNMSVNQDWNRGSGNVQTAKGFSLEHIGDTTLEFGSIWLKIGSEVMLTILVIKWEANGFPKPMEAKWQSEYIPTRHKLQINFMFNSEILLTQLKNNFHFPPPFLVRPIYFYISLKRIAYYFHISFSFGEIHPSTFY